MQLQRGGTTQVHPHCGRYVHCRLWYGKCARLPWLPGLLHRCCYIGTAAVVLLQWCCCNSAAAIVLLH